MNRYWPKRGLVMFSNHDESDSYIEAYDFDDRGLMINAHPLRDDESVKLGTLLIGAGKDRTGHYLKPKKVLSPNLLFLNQDTENGFAVWYTTARLRQLHYVESLGIPGGLAFVPAMVWKATGRTLSVFALKEPGRPKMDTVLYQAPFFNVYQNGSVCLGTISVKADLLQNLEDFIETWEMYFFNSYFSHANFTGLAKSNIVELWKAHMESGKKFPVTELIKTNYTISAILR